MAKTLQAWCTQNGILKPVKACTGNSATCECGTMQHRLQQREPTPPLQDGQQPDFQALSEERARRILHLAKLSPEGMLEELLAVIHGDGGHYSDAHGLPQAVDAAELKWYAAAVSQDGQQAPSGDAQPVLPYTRTFNAIAAATKLEWGGTAIGISVKAFQNSWSSHPAAASPVPAAPAAPMPQARFDAAMKASWHMVDSLRPAGQPGSYSRGEYNGIVAALKSVRDNWNRNAAAATPAPVPAPGVLIASFNAPTGAVSAVASKFEIHNPRPASVPALPNVWLVLLRELVEAADVGMQPNAKAAAEAEDREDRAWDRARALLNEKGAA